MSKFSPSKPYSWNLRLEARIFVLESTALNWKRRNVEDVIHGCICLFSTVYVSRVPWASHIFKCYSTGLTVWISLTNEVVGKGLFLDLSNSQEITRRKEKKISVLELNWKVLSSDNCPWFQWTTGRGEFHLPSSCRSLFVSWSTDAWRIPTVRKI